MKEFCTIIEKGVTIPKIINDYFNPFEPFWGRLNKDILFKFIEPIHQFHSTQNVFRSTNRIEL